MKTKATKRVIVLKSRFRKKFLQIKGCKANGKKRKNLVILTFFKFVLTNNAFLNRFTYTDIYKNLSYNNVLIQIGFMYSDFDIKILNS